ncbi:translocase [Cellulomonas hominis]|uniref:Translocase n=1 Tax=Cellulomonas hominis TaxID=156981 RepID=A0A511F932_9CELL|nr:twin-arginine translocase TatA/TatE family subunit [Cellulomonas hominis]MBB5471874.1 sec-independent protein translocase protein TatB [Cellulomonas hominis]GEL45715.1 translocase [Cellulomonas hominis]
MLFDINGGELLVILLVAVIVIGPSRLPRYAEQLARLTKQARHLLQDARRRVDDELGDDVKDIDWDALDPRRYDPRRIVRDALLDPEPGTAARTATGTAAGARGATAARTGSAIRGSAPPGAAAAAAPGPPPDTGGPPPFDDEAT